MKPKKFTQLKKQLLLLFLVLLSVNTSKAQNFIKLSAGHSHSLAIKSNGTLWAWGSNLDWQLGDSMLGSSQVRPIQIGTSTNWTNISCGDGVSMGIKSDGTLWAWGSNANGQLGNPALLAHQKIPIQIGVATDWASVSTNGGNTLAIKTDGTLWAFGDNSFGKLGLGTNAYQNTPIQVGINNDWAKVYAGTSHTLAIKTNGTLWAWGYNLYGQLGDNTSTDKNIPTQIGSGNNWSSASVGTSHSVAIKTDGTLWAWGGGFYGQLGNGSYTSNFSPIQIGNNTNWADVSAAFYHTIARKVNGTLFSWGQNINGQLGYGNNSEYASPTQIGSATDWGSLSSGPAHTLAIKNNGCLFTCGSHSNGLLGNGTTLSIKYPAPISVGILNVTACNSYTWTAKNNTVYTSSTYETDTIMIPSANGCDSLVFLNLTVNTNTINQVFTTKPTSCGGEGIIELETYDGYEAISGATDQYFNGTLPSGQFSSYGNAQIDNGQLQLTSANINQNGAFMFTRDPLYFWQEGLEVSFDLNIYSTQPAANSIADGLSFNYGNMTAPLVGHEDGMLDANNGLVVRFKTYQTQRIEIVWNGNVIGTYPIDIHSPSAQKVHIAISLDGKLSMRFGKKILFTNLTLNAWNFFSTNNWKIAWGARTGGGFNRHAVDNIKMRYNTGKQYSIDNWVSKSPIPFFNTAPGIYTASVEKGTCQTNVATADITYKISNFKTVNDNINSNCMGRTVTVYNTLPMDTLVWSDFSSRPTLVNFGNMGDAAFSNGAVQLTPASNNKNGRIIFATKPNVGVFNAKFKVKVWDGNNADGFSFNYGVIDKPLGGETGLVNDLSGGLSICFPTFNTSNVIVRYSNFPITTVNNTYPSGNRSSTFIEVEVSVSEDYKLTVKWDGNTLINNFDLSTNSPYVNADKSNWQFAWGAKTGGANDQHQLDDIIVTGKTGLQYSYDGGNTFEFISTKTIADTQAVSIVIKSDGICIADTTNLGMSNTNLANATTGNTNSIVGTTMVGAGQSPNTTVKYHDNCKQLAVISNPSDFMGYNTVEVFVQNSVNTYNNQPYLPRWYKISPSLNSTTVSAQVKLFFTQDDFNKYNTYATANNWPLLPTSSTDLIGIAKIRITKVSGGVLGTGSPSVITPTATWNATANYWEVEFNTTGFSEFYVHAVNPLNTPLPISLLSFEGQKLHDMNKLKWTTTNEQNNAHFNLQHSVNAQNYETIATISSKALNGNSQTKIDYTAYHNTPSIGHNYYRLEQVDIDGQNTIAANIIDLIWSANGTTVSCYPNPTSDVLNIDLYATNNQLTNVKLLDVTGRVAKQIQAKSIIGMNNIKLSLEGLVSGIYTIQVYGGNTLTHTSRIIKE